MKISNKFDLLIEEEISDISDKVIKLEPMHNSESSAGSYNGGGGEFTDAPGKVNYLILQTMIRSFVLSDLI